MDAGNSIHFYLYSIFNKTLSQSSFEFRSLINMPGMNKSEYSLGLHLSRTEDLISNPTHTLHFILIFRLNHKVRNDAKTFLHAFP